MSAENEQPPTVWVLTISHKHGTNISVYSTEDLAIEELDAYCQENWSDWADGKEPTTDSLVDQYFELAEGAEYYEIQELPINSKQYITLNEN